VKVWLGIGEVREFDRAVRSHDSFVPFGLRPDERAAFLRVTGSGRESAKRGAGEQFLFHNVS
jgi:hypothetical protein